MTEAGVYDALYRDDAPLRPTIEALRAGCALANGPMERIARGSVFLYAIGEDRVLKVYPPPDEEEARAEEVVQKAVHAAELGLEVPRVLAAGEERGWRWLLMERLSGTPARDVWDTLSREELAGISATLGEWMRRFHNDEGVQALRLGESREGWAEALAELSSGVVAKHRRREASERWLERLGPYMASWSPEDETRLIHADLHPGNLMLGRDGEGAWALTGVLDFADTLRAPVGYDLGAPLVHLAGGDAVAVEALLSATYGGAPPPAADELWRWILLHRFSSLAYCVRKWGDGLDGSSEESLDVLGEALFGRPREVTTG